MLAKTSLVLAAAALATAQNSSQSICDKYTSAVFGTNNATNQYLLLKYVVNTALIGNFTPAPTGSKVAVQGILNPNGTYNGTTVNLVPYFDGGLSSTNRSGSAVALNFLDDGGAAPLMNLMPANGTSSNQYKLVTHLYSFFGALLQCSTLGQNGFPAYGGAASMYAVHGFMDLNPTQMNYFISQVGAAAESFGVTADDATAVGTALNGLFNYRCTPATKITSDAELQAICIDPSCPIATSSPDCGAYGAVLVPLVANSTLAMGEGTTVTSTLIAAGQTSAVSGVPTTVTTGTPAAVTSSTSTGSSFAKATAIPIGAVMAAGAFVLAL